MTKKYGHLTLNEGIEIEKLLTHNKSYADVSVSLNRNKSTICREVNTQGKGNYKTHSEQAGF